MAFSQPCWLFESVKSQACPMNQNPRKIVPVASVGRPDAVDPPLLSFLAQAFDDFRSDMSGAPANYIPELSKADPRLFGIAVATIDGHVYEVTEVDGKGRLHLWNPWNNRHPEPMTIQEFKRGVNHRYSTLE